MKKITLLLSLLLLIIGLTSCGEDEFEPVASTEDEARVVMTLSVDNTTYEIKYELYRALFIGNRESLDGGDKSVWSGENASYYIDEINKVIAKRAAQIYAAFRVASTLGIDPYSAEANESVQSAIKLYVYGSPDGGEGSTAIIGYGTYEKYLEALASHGMNYSVGDLMLRYSYLLSKINTHYIGTYDQALGYTGGSLDISDEKLLEYYESADSIRILEAYFQEGTKSEARVNEIRSIIAAQPSINAMAAKIIQYTASDYTELLDSSNQPIGKIVGRYELDDRYFLEYTAAAFAIKDGEVSTPIHVTDVNDSYTDGYYILIGMEKSAAYFESYKDRITESYINNEIGKILYRAETSLASGAQFTTAYNEISHCEIVK